MKGSPSGIIALRPGDKGAHLRYPPDGAVHETDPNAPNGSRYTFRPNPGEPLSLATFSTFGSYEVPSSGPPAAAQPWDGRPGNVLEVSAPSTGTGKFFGVAVAPELGDAAQAEIARRVGSSAYTCQMGTFGKFAYLLVYDPTGSF